MIMTEFEIKRAYREARNRRQQIRILADLNGCPVNKIKLIIADEVLAVTDLRKRDLNERRKLYDEGHTDAEIAQMLGLTPAGIRTWRKQNGLERNISHKVDYNELSGLYNQGYSDREIANTVGCEISYISSWRYRHGMPVNTRREQC